MRLLVKLCPKLIKSIWPTAVLRSKLLEAVTEEVECLQELLAWGKITRGAVGYVTSIS